MKNTIICPNCGEELDNDFRKVIRGSARYYEYGIFSIDNLIDGINDIEDIKDVDELEELLQNNVYEIDTEATEYDDWQSDEDYVECRHCDEQISLYDIAKQIIGNKKEPRDMNIDFYVKNADNIH
ncbi:MAG: hypothetical protein RBT05_03550 [Bacteroidales bacterium]|jgi:hypothetical protein|nr:hypothetical protein [Bacteroidales bacterium]